MSDKATKIDLDKAEEKAVVATEKHIAKKELEHTLIRDASIRECVKASQKFAEAHTAHRLDEVKEKVGKRLIEVQEQYDNAEPETPEKYRLTGRIFAHRRDLKLIGEVSDE